MTRIVVVRIGGAELRYTQDGPIATVPVVVAAALSADTPLPILITVEKVPA